MSITGFERFTGVLTLAVVGYLVVLAVPRLRAGFSGPTAAALGLVISGGATAGSLALSWGLGLEPCELCWYQRIFMYPLPILIGLGMAWRIFEIRRFVIVLAALGSAISVYHLVVQWVPGAGTCSVDNPCSARIFEFLGFVSIPAMALVAFAGTIFSMFIWRET